MSLLLHPAVDTAVAQCIVRSEQTGEFFMSQAHPESDGSTSVRISRMSSSGAFLDEMMCTGGGHGTSIALSTINGKVQIWMPWEVGGFGSPRQNDLVRFEYQAGTFHRDDLSSLVVQIPGPTLRYVTFDYTGGYAMVRTPSSTTETYERYALTTWQANDTNPPQFSQTINIGTTTTQGFCTYEDAFYRYSGGANAPSGDTQKVVEYSWQTGAAVRTLSTVGLGKDSSGNWIGGRAEPEGCTLHAGGGRPRLYLGVTTGPSPGGPHGYYLWSLSLMTKAEMIAGAATTPPGTTTGFIYGQTEPTYGNTGAGTLAPAPTAAYTGSMAPTTSVTISNRIITGVIKPGGPGVTITLVNCVVRLNPAGLTADTRALTATGNGKIVAQFCDITATGPSLWVNAAGTKNITLDRCYIYNVVDGVDSLGGITLRGCLIEKLLRLADSADASGVSHNDGVQIVGGAGHTIFGCAIHGFNSSWSTVPSRNNVSTTAVMLTPNLGAITGLSITYNWIYGGDYPINGLHLDGAAGNSGEIAFNRFGSLAGQDGHTIDLAPGQDNITTHDNVYLGGGPVTVYRGGTGTKDKITGQVPPPSGTSTGTEPSGSGVVSYTGLSGSTFPAKVTSAPTIGFVSFPSDTFQFANFAVQTDYGVVYGGKGFLGSGPGATVIRMVAGSSSKASLVPTAVGTTNPLYLMRLTNTGSGCKFDGFHLQGTSQGHLYNGMRISSMSAPVLSNMKVSAIPGNSAINPGETFHINVANTSSLTAKNVVLDGANLGASGWGANSSSGGSYTDCSAVNMHYCKGWAGWQHSGGATFTRFSMDNNAFHFGFERCAGVYTLNNCTFGTATRADIHLASDTSARAHLVINNPVLPSGKTHIKVLLSSNELGHPNLQSESDVKVYVNGLDKSADMLIFVTSA